jgi:hypothetical protein
VVFDLSQGDINCITAIVRILKTVFPDIPAMRAEDV